MCWSSSDHKCSHSRLQAPYKTIFKVFSLSSTSFGLNHLSEILHSSLNRIPDPCLWGFALFFIFICVCLFLPCFCLSFCQPPATAGTARDQLKEYFSFQHSSLISEGSARQLTFRELAIKLWICSLSSWRAATFLAAGCPCIEPMSRALITQKGATQLQRQQRISKPGLSGIESFCFHCSFRDLCSLLWTDSEKKTNKPKLLFPWCGMFYKQSMSLSDCCLGTGSFAGTFWDTVSAAMNTCAHCLWCRQRTLS